MKVLIFLFVVGTCQVTWKGKSGKWLVIFGHNSGIFGSSGSMGGRSSMSFAGPSLSLVVVPSSFRSLTFCATVRTRGTTLTCVPFSTRCSQNRRTWLRARTRSWALTSWLSGRLLERVLIHGIGSASTRCSFLRRCWARRLLSWSFSRIMLLDALAPLAVLLGSLSPS